MWKSLDICSGSTCTLAQQNAAAGAWQLQQVTITSLSKKIIVSVDLGDHSQHYTLNHNAADEPVKCWLLGALFISDGKVHVSDRGDAWHPNSPSGVVVMALLLGPAMKVDARR